MGNPQFISHFEVYENYSRAFVEAYRESARLSGDRGQ
jgi:hypothetical protein